MRPIRGMRDRFTEYFWYNGCTSFMIEVWRKEGTSVRAVNAPCLNKTYDVVHPFTGCPPSRSEDAKPGELTVIRVKLPHRSGGSNP